MALVLQGRVISVITFLFPNASLSRTEVSSFDLGNWMPVGEFKTVLVSSLSSSELYQVFFFGPEACILMKKT